MQDSSVNSNANFEKTNVVKLDPHPIDKGIYIEDEIIVMKVLSIFKTKFIYENPNKLMPTTDSDAAEYTVDRRSSPKTFYIKVPVMYIYKINNCWDGTKVGSWKITVLNCNITAKISDDSAGRKTVDKPLPTISYQCHGSDEYIGNNEIERVCAHGKDSTTNKIDTIDRDDEDSHDEVSTTNKIDTIDRDDENSQGKDSTTNKIDTIDRDSESNRNKFSPIETIDFNSTIISTFVNMTLRRIAEQNPNRDLPVVDESDFNSATVHEDNLSRKLYMINVTIIYRETVCPNRIEPECLCIFEFKNCKIMGSQELSKLNVDPIVSFQCYDNRDEKYLHLKKYYHAKCVVYYIGNEMKAKNNQNSIIDQTTKIAEICDTVEEASSKPNDNSEIIRCLEMELKKIADESPELDISTVVEGKIN